MFTGWFGFILVIPSEVQENVTDAPEKPGKYKYTITSLWPYKYVKKVLKPARMILQMW